MTALPWQVEPHSSTSRFIVCCCGRRAGKTAFGGREVALQAAVPESMIWIVAPEMNLGDKEFKVVWDIAVRKKLLPVEGKSKRERWIDFANGSRVEVRTEENPDQLIGEGVDLMIIAEAARLKPLTWEELLRPTLMDRPGRAIFTSTPRGKNFFHRLWQKGQAPDQSDWASWKLPSRVNPFNLASDLDEIDELIRSDPVTNAHLRQEYWADFVTYRGLVFLEFSNVVHVRAHHYEPHLKTMLWIDPGITNPYAVLLVQITPEEEVRVLDEIYVRGTITDEIIAAAERKWPYVMFDGGVIGNPPNPELEVVIDEAAAESIAAWRMKGYQAYGVKPPLRSGIDVHHRMLRDPFRRVDTTEENPLGIWPRITFDPRCENSIDEYNLYHYPEEERRRSDQGPTEVPVDADNHSISAVRYGLYALWPHLFNEERARVETTNVTAEELDALGYGLDRMKIDSSYAGEYESEEERFGLGSY